MEPFPDYTEAMHSYRTETEYLEALEERAALPEGFVCATTGIRFLPGEREVKSPLAMNLSLVLLEKETPIFAGVFTRNRFPGAPVLMGRDTLGKRTARGVFVNNKISNVSVPGGRENAERLLNRIGGLVGCPADSLFTASTGIIGWKLPVAEMEEAIPGLVKDARPGSILPVARAIMTTDSFPKVRRASPGRGSILGIAKGAGMIEPNMATMLCFVFTDVSIPRGTLRRGFTRCVERTLNRISVDGDQSTSDTALLFSSGTKSGVDPAVFFDALMEVLSGLAEDIVRNAEGAGHVIRARVRGARDERTAAGIGKAIINSPLVKTAIYGNDPNVGRIVCAIGDYLGNAGIRIDASGLTIRLGGTEIFSGGSFRLDEKKEGELAAYLKAVGFDPKIKGYPQNDKTVDIEVLLRGRTPMVEVMGTDLSYEYVRENADYRS
jgi:glutamate N-acetyltransferase/amino-acid N-acetyltransferase